jgi:hypothetical protein
MKLFYSLLILGLSILSNPIIAKQNSFPSAKEAANSLHQAIEKNDKVAINNLFGAENIHLLPIDTISEKEVKDFLNSWSTAHKIITADKELYYIEIGDNKWTFPIPLVKTNDGWIFDTITGSENIIIRRVGANELDTIQAILAYYDAQLEYATVDINGDKTLEYAQKFISAPGQKDGLYWETKEGETLSPLGSLFSNKVPESAYNGYYYRILTSQGKDAKGGAYNYIISNKMTSGFALIAWPATFGKSGIMSFMISHAGIIYEKNLGPEVKGKEISIDTFNPDSSWHIVEEDK